MTGDLFEQDAAASSGANDSQLLGSSPASSAQLAAALEHAPVDRTSIEYYAALQHTARHGERPEWGPK